MPKASVTRLIERDKKTLINFVLDIEKYPEFIPFCIDSKVYEKKEEKNSINIIHKFQLLTNQTIKNPIAKNINPPALN